MLFEGKEKLQQLNQSSNSEKKFIATDLEKCTGCGICEIICSIKRENQYNSRCSRIKILRIYQLVNLAMTCRLCNNAPCVISCPQQCLVQSEKTGIIIVDENKCDCCGLCIEVCPHGAISLHPKKETVLICDLCDGEPQCIEWCPEEALNLLTQKELDKNILEATEKIFVKETLGFSEDTISITKKMQSDNEKLIKSETQTEKEENSFIQQAKQKKAIRKSLNLLFDAFAQPNPIEILLYGMFVKKHLATMVPSRRKEKIEKTLEWLEEAICLVEKYKLTHLDHFVLRNNGPFGKIYKKWGLAEHITKEGVVVNVYLGLNFNPQTQTPNDLHFYNFES